MEKKKPFADYPKRKQENSTGTYYKKSKPYEQKTTWTEEWPSTIKEVGKRVVGIERNIASIKKDIGAIRSAMEEESEGSTEESSQDLATPGEELS